MIIDDWDTFIDHHCVTSFALGGSTVFLVERKHFLWEFPESTPQINQTPGCHRSGNKVYVAIDWTALRNFYDKQRME